MRLKPDSAQCGFYPELIAEVGTISRDSDINGDALINVQFTTSVKLVLLNVAASDFEPVE